MFVLTINQQGSRRLGDRVDPLLLWLAELTPAGSTGVVRGFERTVGDEVQGLFDHAGTVVDVVLAVLRRGGWSVGIGAGAVDEPVPESVRAAGGAALVLAREAVEAAKSRSRAVPVAVRGADRESAAHGEAVLVLIAALADRRSLEGWAAIDALAAPDGTRRQDEVAVVLGISQQAVSQRLRTALWHEEVAARPAAAALLTSAAAEHPGPRSR